MQPFIMFFLYFSRCFYLFLSNSILSMKTLFLFIFLSILSSGRRLFININGEVPLARWYEIFTASVAFFTNGSHLFFEKLPSFLSFDMNVLFVCSTQPVVS
ncbi:putative transposable element [Pseudoloma neurophilia]|uniref:Putative transposable element n=1 Tax=Pseudoloma neurophilia TaxID=146866 RepID=A0A0R0LV67_9MICR|nr:putative transposable element [Pseudoloma neurophilia]